MMTRIDYIINYLIPSWFQTFNGNFRIWRDLITGNYKDYALMWYDDPYEECYEWFWESLSYDDTLPKDFLEHLQEMVKEIESGKVKTVSFKDDREG
jgi:hypothetical protein